MSRIHRNNRQNVQTTNTNSQELVTLPRQDKVSQQCLEPTPQRQDAARQLVKKDTRKPQNQRSNSYRKPSQKGGSTGTTVFDGVCMMTSQGKKGVYGLLNAGCTLLKGDMARKNYGKQKTKAQKFDSGVAMGQGSHKATELVRNKLKTTANKLRAAKYTKGGKSLASQTFQQVKKAATKNFLKKNPGILKQLKGFAGKMLKSRLTGKALKVGGRFLNVASAANETLKYNATRKLYMKEKASVFKLYYSALAAGTSIASVAISKHPMGRFFSPGISFFSGAAGYIRDKIK